MPANLENSSVTTGLEGSVFIPIPKKGNDPKCLHYCKIILISHASKVMLKICQARQQYMYCELPDVQAGFKKGRGTRDQIAYIHWIIEKAREFQNNIYFCFIDYSENEFVQSCLTLCAPMNCSLSGSSIIIGIFQARVREWVAISFSRGIFQTQVIKPRSPTL